jgi:hypothetical protein
MENGSSGEGKSTNRGFLLPDVFCGWNGMTRKEECFYL